MPTNAARDVRVEGNGRFNIGDTYYQTEDRCLADLRTTDPRLDKTRIVQTKGGLLAGAWTWILENDDFRQWRHGEDTRLL